jgi:hypothetical protein
VALGARSSLLLAASTVTAMVFLAFTTTTPASDASASPESLHLTVTGGPKGVVNEHFATFRFTANLAVDGFHCKLDQRPSQPCESPVTFRHLGPGRHALQVGTSFQTLHGGEGVDEMLSWKIMISAAEAAALVKKTDGARWARCLGPADGRPGLFACYVRTKTSQATAFMKIIVGSLGNGYEVLKCEIAHDNRFATAAGPDPCPDLH